MAAAGSSLRRRTAAYAELVRVPNVFTAPPDVLLGAALVAATGADGAGAPRPTAVAVAGAVAASALLYAGGTALNDYFDADVDAAERPERPIPSGRVGRSTALAVGAGLTALGVVVALVAAGSVTAVVAAALALVILLYDGVLKGSAAGFLTMGVTRGLDVALGVAAATAGSGRPFPTAAADVAVVGGVPVAITGYIAAVTYMAAEEAGGVDRRAVAVGATGTSLAALAVPVAYALADASLAGAAVGTAIAVGFAVWTGRALRRAYADPTPETVGPAVGTCVLAVVALDAAFAAVAGPIAAASVAAFLLPAVGLARAFDVS